VKYDVQKILYDPPSHTYKFTSAVPIQHRIVFTSGRKDLTQTVLLRKSINTGDLLEGLKMSNCVNKFPEDFEVLRFMLAFKLKGQRKRWVAITHRICRPSTKKLF
jgi:hypothetical protein